jgi:putative heme-binding domain-containing protein
MKLVFVCALGAAVASLPAQDLFNPTCSNGYCHGAEGVGGGGPSLRGKAYTLEQLIGVISDGVPNTAMRGFKEDYTPQQIRQLAAYVMSLGKKGAPPATTASATLEPGAGQAGRALFFDAADPKSCRSCHAFQGVGGKLGPDLATARKRSAREWYQAIVNPAAAVDPAYALVSVTTRDGEKFLAIRRGDEKFLDFTTLPFVTRTLSKEQVAAVTAAPGTAMPRDYAAKYSQQQMLDLIAFLLQAPVTSKDVF